MTAFCELILGGARSGKSTQAEQRALRSGLQRVYIATATAGDAEMAARITHHQQRRDEGWMLVEAPLDLAGALLHYHASDRCIVVDCLTLWLSNCLHRDCWEPQQQALFAALSQLSGHIVLVSNETGLGVVPIGDISRRFVDAAGFMHQRLAALCEEVTLTVAGLPVTLKSPSQQYR